MPALSAAAAERVARGFDAAHIDRIARAAGISKNSIHR